MFLTYVNKKTSLFKNVKILLKLPSNWEFKLYVLQYKWTMLFNTQFV